MKLRKYLEKKNTFVSMFCREIEAIMEMINKTTEARAVEIH